MKLRRIMLAAPKSGSGKTFLTCALLQVLKDENHTVVSYKCGPDYIDPMFHETVIGIPSKNLDTFFTDARTTRELLYKNRTGEELAVLEGVMGIFDGLGGTREEGSSYHLAKVTNTPIVLVVDAKGMGRSVIPLIAGFLSYDTEHLIKGVILNRMSKAYYELIRPLMEEELGIAVLGYFPEMKEFTIESRHLGLYLPTEIAGLKKQLKQAADKLRETVSVEKLLELMEEGSCDEKELEDNEKSNPGAQKIKIAVARDEAFCFYYEDNLRILEEAGAELKYFSPIHDNELPKDCDALLFGGGYPELYLKKLSENLSMRQAVSKAGQSGMPMVAECGGFMYLHKEIMDKNGNGYPMVGIVSGTCYYTGKLVRFGYIEMEEQEENFLPEDQRIRGHEFHYYDSTCNGDACRAIKPTTGRSYPCVVQTNTCWMGFPHLYYPSNPSFAAGFVKKAVTYKTTKHRI